MNLSPITFDDRTRPHKSDQYTPYILPDNIYFDLENYFSTLTNPSDYPDLLPSDDPNTLHVMNMDVTVLGRVHRGYGYRKHDTKYATKIQGSIDPHALIRTRSFIIVIGFTGLIQRQGLASWKINVLCHNVSVDCYVCLPYILYFAC